MTEDDDNQEIERVNIHWRNIREIIATFYHVLVACLSFTIILVLGAVNNIFHNQQAALTVTAT